MTSSDVLDTGLALQMRDAAEVLIEDASKVLDLLKRRALEHRATVMIGRTHGVHAEPITFGLKLAVWAFEMRRDLDRLVRAQSVVSCGKISGAVGTYASLDQFVEKYVCDRLGLKPAEASTQIIQRDRHAEYMCALAVMASSLEKYATEIRGLQRTEVLEALEPFREGQTGSSAMPHKRNPVICERICGLARVVRGNAVAAFEDMALWHERDISHSSAERVIFPDSFAILDYILEKTIFVIGNIIVMPKNMQRNLMKYGGIIFSQRILLELINKGISREEAYILVQNAALKAWEEEGSFKENLLKEEKITRLIAVSEIEALFDVGYHLKYVDTIINRLQ